MCLNCLGLLHYENVPIKCLHLDSLLQNIVYDFMKIFFIFLAIFLPYVIHNRWDDDKIPLSINVLVTKREMRSH